MPEPGDKRSPQNDSNPASSMGGKPVQAPFHGARVTRGAIFQLIFRTIAGGALPKRYVARQPSTVEKICLEFALRSLMTSPIALVAEDDADLRDLLGSALSSAGFEVRKARDGLELLANTALPETLPDLI